MNIVMVDREIGKYMMGYLNIGSVIFQNLIAAPILQYRLKHISSKLLSNYFVSFA